MPPLPKCPALIPGAYEYDETAFPGPGCVKRFKVGTPWKTRDYLGESDLITWAVLKADFSLAGKEDRDTKHDKEQKYCCCPGQAAQLEHCPVHQKLVGSIPGSRHIPRLRVQSPVCNRLVCVFLSPPSSLSKINKNILG